MKVLVFALIVLSFIPIAFAQEFPELGVRVETVAENLTIPWSIDWTPDGDAFFTERNAKDVPDFVGFIFHELRSREKDTNAT